jgi:dTDP-4-amino-4,6-dideoxygalactose transaminase
VESVHFWSRTHADVNADEFPEVRYLRNHVLELPIHQGLRERHVEYVASTLKEIL